jgi:hypothetical protein
MAHQAILSAFEGVGHGWHLSGLLSRLLHTFSNLVARQTGFITPALVVCGEGLHLADVMAHQAIFLAFEGVGHGRHLSGLLSRLLHTFSNLVAG